MIEELVDLDQLEVHTKSLIKNNEIASWITAPQYAEYHVVLNPRIIIAITTNDLKNVFINRFEVGISQRFICKLGLILMPASIDVFNCEIFFLAIKHKHKWAVVLCN